MMSGRVVGALAAISLAVAAPAAAASEWSPARYDGYVSKIAPHADHARSTSIRVTARHDTRGLLAFRLPSGTGGRPVSLELFRLPGPALTVIVGRRRSHGAGARAVRFASTPGWNTIDVTSLTGGGDVKISLRTRSRRTASFATVERSPMFAPRLVVGPAADSAAPAVDSGGDAQNADCGSAPPALFFDPFCAGTTGPKLLTNEFARYNPGGQANAAPGPWTIGSGSLFAKDGHGWTGPPDDCEAAARAPNAGSTTCTNSSVFRLTTVRQDFHDVKVSMRLWAALSPVAFRSPLASDSPDVDGVQLLLRYQSQYELYYAAVARRSGEMVIKKKCPGGSVNGGTYHELTPYVPGGAPSSGWELVGAEVADQADGSVRVTILRDGAPVLTGVDDGAGCPPIRAPGAVGVRGDNAELDFDDFEVSALP